MGTFVLSGSNQIVRLGGYVLNDVTYTMALEYGAESVDSTVLSDDTRVMRGGLEAVGFSADLYWDNDSSNFFTSTVGDNQQFGFVGDTQPLTILNVANDVAYICGVRNLNTDLIRGSVGEMAGANISGGAVQPLVRGVPLLNAATQGAGNTAAVQVSSASGTYDLYLNVHAANTIVSNLTLQNDDNAGFTSPTTIISTGSLSGTDQSTNIVVEGITDPQDYWRLSITTSGAITSPLVAFGLKAVG